MKKVYKSASLKWMKWEDLNKHIKNILENMSWSRNYTPCVWVCGGCGDSGGGVWVDEVKLRSGTGLSGLHCSRCFSAFYAMWEASSRETTTI